MLLLLAILGCSPEGQVYDECVAHTELMCDCNNPGWVDCDPADAPQMCDEYSLTVCDVESPAYDEAACSTAHQNVESWEGEMGTPENLDLMACMERRVRRQCRKAQESDEAAAEIWTAAYEACR